MRDRVGQAAWDAGAERLLDFLVDNGVATTDGADEAETVAFLAAPSPQYV